MPGPWFENANMCVGSFLLVEDRVYLCYYGCRVRFRFFDNKIGKVVRFVFLLLTGSDCGGNYIGAATAICLVRGKE